MIPTTRLVQEGNYGRFGWANYPGSVAINPLDLLYLDSSGNIQPASAQADQLTPKANQLLFAQNFVGLAGAAKLATDPADANFPVITDAIMDMVIASASPAIGDLMAASENSGGTALLNDTLLKTTDPAVALGEVMQKGSSVTLARVRLKSDVLQNGRKSIRFGEIYQSVAVADFTDGGSTAGTLDLTDKLPAGAIVLGWTFDCTGAFAGDTTAVLTVGISGTGSKFSADATQSVFTTGKKGSSSTAATSFQATEISPRLTITGGADFSSIVSNAGGAGKIRIRYMVFAN